MSENLCLTDIERERFALFCAQQASSANDIVSQMEKIHVPAPVIKKMKLEAAAFSIVAIILRTTESASIE